MTTDKGRERRHGWFVTRKDGRRSYFGGGSGIPLPGPPEGPGPTVVRMFVDDLTGIGLWSDGALYPSELPFSAELAAAVQAWVDDWTDHFGAEDFDEEAHDWRGHALSLRVQEELGGDHRVTFTPQSRAVKDALEARADD